jgi:hypothetical protein
VQLALELESRPDRKLAVPVNRAAGEVYAGPDNVTAKLKAGDTIAPWQAQWLETMGHAEVPVFVKG